MRLILLLLIIAFSIASCQKAVEPSKDITDPISELRTLLRDSLTAKEYANLDWKNITRITAPGKARDIYRVGFIDDSGTHLFFTRTRAKEMRGRRVILSADPGRGGRRLSLQALSGAPLPVGFADSPVRAERTSAYPDYKELPEVVIVSTRSRQDTYDFSTWVSMPYVFYDYGLDQSWDNWYMESGGGGGGSSSSGNPSSGHPASGQAGNGGTRQEEAMEVDYENQYDDPAIDLREYINCFNKIPDAGATVSIELFTDIPVDDDPSKIFNWENGSPGHVFLQLKKVNGARSATQNIGFYPLMGWKTVFGSSVSGKYVDNREHEFNAAIRVSLTTAQFAKALSEMKYLLDRDLRYDIDDYNCTDWALQIFNAAVPASRKLTVPKFQIPGSYGERGANTPQGVYMQLKSLIKAGGAGAVGVSMPVVGWVGQSNGPCK